MSTDDVNIKQPTLCLNMIVKNESKIITRLLQSVVSIVDSYCICDTGSTDGTQEIIRDFFNKHNITGKIVEEPFVNFCHNRNFALQSCKGMTDYVLLMDADMVLEIPEDGHFDKSKLICDYYGILQGNNNFYYNNTRIVRNNGEYKYLGVTHEYISSPPRQISGKLLKTDIFIRDIGDGGSKGDKFERDIRLLNQGIIDEPNNERYYFYLANSYYDSGKTVEAISKYESRIKMGGWFQEIWFSYYRIGLSYMRLNEPEKAISAWLSGYEYFPKRIENLYEIVKHYRVIGQQKLGYMFYKIANDIITSGINKDDYLFLRNDVYTYGLIYEYTILASYNNIKNVNDQLITLFNNCDNSSITKTTLSNMKYYKDILVSNKNVDFTNTITRFIHGKNRDFNASSASIIPIPAVSLIQNTGTRIESGKYIMNIRYVNYTIDSKGCYHNCEDKIITINKCVILDSSLNIVYDLDFDSIENDTKYLGIEDVRIFAKDDVIHFVGTVCRQTGKLGINYGIYHTHESQLISQEIEPSFANNNCEKNWIFVNPKHSNMSNEISSYNLPEIVYSWYPLRICSLNLEKNTLDLHREITKLPLFFKYMRGSTNGVIVDNEMWFITHIVSYESPRHYYHCLVIFDESMKTLLRYSAPFKFEGICIEYCLSFVVDDNKVMIPYSKMDSQCQIAIYDKEYIQSKASYTYHK